MDPLILYILIFAALVVIAGLVAFVVYYRRRLNILQSAMARCIEENIEMKDKLCELKSSTIPAASNSSPRISPGL